MNKTKNKTEQVNEEQPSTAMGITGFIFSILGLLLFLMPYIAVFLSLIGLVLGIIQVRKHSTGLGVAAIVIGAISGLLNFVLTMAIFAALAAFGVAG